MLLLRSVLHRKLTCLQKRDHFEKEMNHLPTIDFQRIFVSFRGSLPWFYLVSIWTLTFLLSPKLERFNVIGCAWQRDAPSGAQGFGFKVSGINNIKISNADGKVVLELCDNPEKLIGYWLFASSGGSFCSLQRNLFKEMTFLFWNESDCCTYTSPTWRENARFAQAEIGLIYPLHCRLQCLAESVSEPGLFALVFGPRSAAETV